VASTRRSKSSIAPEATPEKQATTVYVRKLFCDYGFPIAAVYIAPIPRLSGQLEIWTYVQMLQFASLAETVNLPQGYEIALRYNFAVALLPEYPREGVDPTLVAQATQYKASLVQLNQQNHMRSQAMAQAPAA
jgi:hypothetical protein